MSWTITAYIGVGFVAVGLALAANEYLWLRQARIGHGTVVELIKSKGRGISYTPRVRFRADDGSEHEFTRKFYTGPVGFVLGQRVLVAYNPRTFEGRILGFGQRFGLAIVFVSVGVAIVVMAACFIFGESLFSRIYQQPATAVINDRNA